MQLPVKAHYAVVAMLALAERYERREPMPVRSIASERQIPTQFLTQIFQQLRSAGMVVSTRGANGGFLLAREPDCISVGDVLDVICPLAAGGPEGSSQSRFGEAATRVWEDLYNHQVDFLNSVSLQDMLNRVSQAAPMFYI